MIARLWLPFLVFSLTSLSAFEGGYVGGSVGGSLTVGRDKGKREVVDSSSDFTLDQIFEFNSQLCDGSADGTLFAGYGSSYGCLYLGLEGFIRFSHNRFSIHRDNGLSQPLSAAFSLSEIDRSTINIGPWHYGLDVRPGFLIDPCTLLYGRAGVEWSEVRLKESSAVSFSESGGGDSFFISARDSNRRHSPHLRLGFGIEKRLPCNFSLRTDYIYTDYGRVKTHTHATSVDGRDESVAFSGKEDAHLKNFGIEFGLSYYFCPQSCDSCCPTPCDSPSFKGFYLAGALGGTLLNATVNGTVQNFLFDSTTSDPSLTHTYAPSHKLEDITFSGMASAGFGTTCCCDCLYIGIEGFVQCSEGRGNYFYSTQPGPLGTTVNFAGVALPATILSLNTTTRGEVFPFQGGVAIRPGCIINRSILTYGILGTSVARLKAFTDMSAVGVYEARGAGIGLATLTYSRSATRASLRLGGGIEYVLTPKWHIRSEFFVDNYGKLNLKDSKITQTNNGGATGVITDTLTNDIDIYFRMVSANIGLAYYF